MEDQDLIVEEAIKGDGGSVNDKLDAFLMMIQTTKMQSLFNLHLSGLMLYQLDVARRHENVE